MNTAASVFFKTLADAGVTHAFVNWGSDHSAFLEDLQRQRAELGKTVVEIVTCPSEYVALSAAHGYAHVTGKPAAVIVHVDVGTQASASLLSRAALILMFSRNRAWRGLFIMRIEGRCRCSYSPAGHHFQQTER